MSMRQPDTRKSIVRRVNTKDEYEGYCRISRGGNMLIINSQI